MVPGQHRSRVGSSTLSKLLRNQNNVMEGLFDGANIDVVYVNFKKVFDKVNHGILAHKLYDLGVTQNFGGWIQS